MFPICFAMKIPVYKPEGNKLVRGYLVAPKLRFSNFSPKNFAWHNQTLKIAAKQGYRNFEIQIGPLDRWRHRRHTNMSSTIPNSHENSSFSSKSVSEIDYFSDRVQLQPVVSKQDNPKSLASDRCLLNTGVHQYLLWCSNPPIFSVSQWVSFFFIKSLRVYKFQGRQPFRTFKLNIFFQTMQFYYFFASTNYKIWKVKLTE